jgi:uncharacterized membrane protein YhdT
MTSGWALLLIAIYFVPWIVASYRQKRNAPAIGQFNLFFGWTIVGWAIAMIWAAMHEAPKESSKQA